MLKILMGILSVLLATMQSCYAAKIDSTVEGSPENVIIKSIVSRTAAETNQDGKLFVGVVLQGAFYVVDGNHSSGQLALALPSGASTPHFENIQRGVSSREFDFNRHILHHFGIPFLDLSHGMEVEIYLGYGTDAIDMASRGNFVRLYPAGNATADADPFGVRFTRRPVDLENSTQLVGSIGKWMQRASARATDQASFQESPDYLFAGMMVGSAWRSLVDAYDGSRTTEIADDGSVILQAAGNTVITSEGTRIVASGRLTLPAPSATTLACGDNHLSGYSVFLDCDQKLVTYENNTDQNLRVFHSTVPSNTSAINYSVSDSNIANFDAMNMRLASELKYYSENFFSAQKKPTSWLAFVGGKNLSANIAVGRPAPPSSSPWGLKGSMSEHFKPVLNEYGSAEERVYQKYLFEKKSEIFNKIQDKFSVFVEECYRLGQIEWDNRNAVRGHPLAQCTGDPENWVGDCADGVTVKGMIKTESPNIGEKVFACSYNSYYTETLLPMEALVQDLPWGSKDIREYALYEDKERKRQMDAKLVNAVKETLNMVVGFAPVLGLANGAMKCFTGKSIIDRFDVSCNNGARTEILEVSNQSPQNCSFFDTGIRLAHPAENKLACISLIPGTYAPFRVLSAYLSSKPALGLFMQSHKDFISLAALNGPAVYSSYNQWVNYWDSK